MGPMSNTFRIVDPYLNPKNRGMPRPEVLAEAAKKEREYQARTSRERKAAKGCDRHPDWSPYFQRKYEPVDTSSRKNLVGGTHLVPMSLRYIPPTERKEALDGGMARQAADRKAKDDKQGIPDWSPYFRGHDNPMQRPKSAGAARRAPDAASQTFSETKVFDPKEPLASSRHQFDTTNRARAREEAFFRERRARRPQSASATRRRAW